MRARLLDLVGRGRDVVVDLSLWARCDRDRYKQLVEDAGARWRLVYLRADPAVLRRRLAERGRRFDANAAFPITDDMLDAYVSGFQAPDGEGEGVVTVEG